MVTESTLSTKANVRGGGCPYGKKEFPSPTDKGVSEGVPQRGT